MKTVISAAGNLKRENPTMNEVCGLYKMCTYVCMYVHVGLGGIPVLVVC